MFRLITPARMQAMERAFMQETGTPGLLLMERAATALVAALETLTTRGALFLCGPGNNGGDGYAAARLWHDMGHAAWIWTLSDPQALTGDARVNWERCVRTGIGVQWQETLPAAPPEECGAVVDALFGTGLARPLEGVYAGAVRWINACGLPVLAVDIPSGTPPLMVRADATVAFHRMKPQHLLMPGRMHAGQITVADIGLPYAGDGAEYEVLEPDDAGGLLDPRPTDAHKGTAGHALLLAGSTGMAGAAALSANAAIRGGAGLVSVACPAEIVPIVQTLAPCATCISPSSLRKSLTGKAAVGAGPGLGGADAIDDLLETLSSAPVAQVWDADALNWLAGHRRRLGERFVLTPHPGEAARLLGSSAHAIAENPIAAAEALHEQYGATILLKGAVTVILGEGRRALNNTGTPGMATGGSGDVLTGLILALLAQGLTPFAAAQSSALLHGLAGISAAKTRGIRSMNAWDLLDALHID